MLCKHTSIQQMITCFEHILHKEWSQNIHVHCSVTLNCLVSETLSHLKSFQKVHLAGPSAPDWLLIETPVLSMYYCCLTCVPLLPYLCISDVFPVYLCCLTCVSLLSYILCTFVSFVILSFLCYLFCLTSVVLSLLHMLSYLCIFVVLPVYLCCFPCVTSYVLPLYLYCPTCVPMLT